MKTIRGAKQAPIVASNSRL